MIVEDDAIIYKEMESSLENIGYEVVEAAQNGQEAIEKAEASQPGIILMDIKLKGVMDGIEAAEIIRSRFHIPIIFVTAFADKKRLERAKKVKPFGYLLKPVQERYLETTIEIALYTHKMNVERDQAQSALKQAHEELEQKVVERTEALQKEIDSKEATEQELRSNMAELERFSKLAVDRELQMIKLKKEVNDLSEKLGQEYKYSIDESEI